MTKKKKEVEFSLDIESPEESEILRLTSKIKELESENITYRELIRLNGLETELDEFQLSDEEFICLEGIRAIKVLVENKMFSKDDISTFEILHKRLESIRGNAAPVRKEKKKSREELLKLIKKS